MNVFPLGTNGFFPSFNKQTACYAVPYGKILILLDAGSGLFRLAEPEGKKLLKGVDEVHLYLSHYHLDHTFGFYAAFKLLQGKKVIVFGNHNKQVFSEFITLKYFPVDYAAVHKNFQWQTLKEGRHNISSYKVAVRQQYHRGEGSLAFRFDFPTHNGLAYVTDSEPTEGSIRLVTDVPLLLHEWEFGRSKVLPTEKIKLEKEIHGGHVTTIGAALIAKRAKVGKLVLIHHDPFADERKLQSQLKLARAIFPKTELAGDLKEINF